MALTGIARLASLSPLLDSKKLVTYQNLPTRSLINRTTGQRYFDWTINPYRGCEFACRYCYARYTHEFMELRDPADFENKIFAKHFSAAGFRRELAAIPMEDHIAMGTATDPYQPAERRYRLTRSILEIVAEDHARRFSITTKSDLVARDAKLLAAISRANVLQINVTITTVDTGLARLLEPRAPRPDLRLRALATLAGHGVLAGVFAAPILPGLNDSRESIFAVARETAANGGRYFSGGALFLKPCARQLIFPFLEERFPHLVEQYREMYRLGAYIKGAYPERIAGYFEEARKQYRLAQLPTPYEPAEAPRQLLLFA